MSSEPYGLCMIQLSLSLLFGQRNYIEITGVSCQIKRMYNSSLFLRLGFPVMHFTRVQIDPDSGSQGTMVRLARKMFCMDFTISTTKTTALQIQQLIRQRRIELGYPTPISMCSTNIETLIYPYGIKRRKKSPSYELVESIWFKHHKLNNLNYFGVLTTAHEQCPSILDICNF